MTHCSLTRQSINSCRCNTSSNTSPQPKSSARSSSPLARGCFSCCDVMARVLLVGYDPEAVDYSNPAYPPGMIAEVSAGIALTLKQTTDRGWESDVCHIRPDKAAGQTAERHLASANYDCVVIGAGVRLPPQGLEIFEAVVNAIHRGAPGAIIAFNTRPEDSADAACAMDAHQIERPRLRRTSPSCRSCYKRLEVIGQPTNQSSKEQLSRQQRMTQGQAAPSTSQ